MATQDKRSMSTVLDRRIQISKPVTTRGEFNEEQTGFVVAYDNFPACRLDTVTSDKEELSNHAEKASNVVEWKIRFLPNLDIRSTWKIKDLHDQKSYDIISPVTEIGRREGLRIKTMLVE